MADDPNRDVLPVKENSYADTIISAIDPRERHLVCKLDRYQLEDKYLRLLDEASNLKKLLNCQEDKIKRLGTKLIRLTGNPRSCGLMLDIADDRNRTAAIELENTKLKEKITVMRNQLLSHTMSGRSSSRSRNLVRPSSSGLITCRSENNRPRVLSCQCIVEPGDDDKDARNYLVAIEKLEEQKKSMACRITELEKELAHSTGTQREKVAENVEYIRVWRQMKQLNDKLMTAQEKNAALTAEINDLKTTLGQTTKNNQEITAVLLSERTRKAEVDNQLLKAKNSQFSLREKDEQIRDLMNEIKILQQHNNELIALTSKYGQVELENIELKKKLSEYAQEQQTLKTAFNNEQANFVSLKTTNEQLLVKLQELQANIDTLTVQLSSFHKQNERRDVIASVATPYSNIEQCKKCCEMYDKIAQLGKVTGTPRKDWQLTDKLVQTMDIAVNVKEQATMTTLENEHKLPLQSPLKEWRANQETNGTNILSREKILKLLDQAQINTPLEASNIDMKGEYASILDVTQRHSEGEISSRTVHDELKLVEENTRKRFASLKNPTNVTLGEMLLILFDILQEYMASNKVDKRTSPDRQSSTIGNPLIDVNNNNVLIATSDIKQNSLNTESDGYYANFASQSIAVHANDFTNPARNEKSTTISTRESSERVNSSKRILPDAPFSPTIYEKYRKSSYRDISREFCAEKIKKLEKSKLPLYPACNLTCQLREAKDSLTPQGKQKPPCRMKCLNDNVKLPMSPKESFPLLITDRQGLVEIHVSRLQLSTSVMRIPNEENICSLQIYISWDVWGEKTAYTPRMRCPNLGFNSSSVYCIADLFAFFKNVLSEYLIFRVNIIRQDDTSRTLARAKVSIKDILDYPQNKLHYIVPVSSVIACLYGVNFGQLSLWVRLSCNVDMVEAFKKQCGITQPEDALHPTTVKKNANGALYSSTSKSPSKHTTDIKASEDLFSKDWNLQDDSALEDARNQHIQSSLDSNFQYDTDNSNGKDYYVDTNKEEVFSPETKVKKIEEENEKISRFNSDHDATDNKGKKEINTLTDTSSMMEFRTLFANCLEKETIIIEIVSLQLLNESSVMQDDEIRYLYIDYSFLGYFGKDMETVSVEKPKTANQKMVYNSKKEFQIDEKNHRAKRNHLRAMLEESVNPNIEFIVISEPLLEDREIKDCEEIGFAILNIRKYALGDGRKRLLLPIKDSRNNQIGTLEIIILGFDAIRQCLPNNPRQICCGTC